MCTGKPREPYVGVSDTVGRVCRIVGRSSVRARRSVGRSAASELSTRRLSRDFCGKQDWLNYFSFLMHIKTQTIVGVIRIGLNIVWHSAARQFMHQQQSSLPSSKVSAPNTMSFKDLSPGDDVEY